MEYRFQFGIKEELFLADAVTRARQAVRSKHSTPPFVGNCQ
jgi:hypothetical protein